MMSVVLISKIVENCQFWFVVCFKIEIMFDEEDYSFSDDEDYVFLGENFMVIFCVKYFI